MFYNILLVSAIHQRESAIHQRDSAVHQHDSAVHRYTCVPSFLSLPPTTSHLSRLSQNAGCELPASYSKFALSILHMVMCMFQCYSLLSQLCPQVCFLLLHLHYCPANRFISTIFLNSIYMH